MIGTSARARVSSVEKGTHMYTMRRWSVRHARQRKRFIGFWRMHIPDDVIARLERTSDPHKEGVPMCIETIQQIRAIEGVAGIHLMATKREHLIQGIVHAWGVLAGRSPQLVAKGAYACPSLD